MLLGKRKNRQSNQSRHNGTHTDMANRKMVQSPMVWNRAGGLAERSALETECVHWLPPEARVAPWEGDIGGFLPLPQLGRGLQGFCELLLHTPQQHPPPPELVAPGSLCFVRDVFQVPVTAEMAQLRSRRWAAHRILKVWHPSILVPRRTRL